MSKILFSDDHEYVRIDGDVCTVGITDYAQGQLGDVVFVELPKVGAKIAKGAQAGVVESVKSASEVYSPLSGEIVAINQAIVDNPALVNQDPLDKGWFFKIKTGNDNELTGLKDKSAYDTYVKGL